MKLINENSLAVTLDNYNNVYYSGNTITMAEKRKLAAWLASRQGIERSYAGMISPTAYDYKHGVTLFTGEKIDMVASIGHIMGEEALRTMYLLDIHEAALDEAIMKSKLGLENAIKRSLSLGHDVKGTYCCGKCTAAYWRNLSAESLSKNRSILNAGLKALNRHRDGKGKWRRFPFHYTILSLTGIDLPAAKEELRYAAASLETLTKRSGESKYAARRKRIAETALGMI